MARGDSGEKTKKVSPRKAGDKKAQGPLLVRLRSGEELEVAGLGMSGYVAAPIGAVFLGGTASRDTVGKFCLGVDYPDGETGIIAQEEIAEIIDAEGNSISYGNAKYPGHPDFDPRDGFDPIQNQINTFKRLEEEREKRRKRVEEVGLAAVLEEEMAKYRKMWGERDQEEDGVVKEEDGKTKKEKEEKKGKRKSKKEKKNKKDKKQRKKKREKKSKKDL